MIMYFILEELSKRKNESIRPVSIFLRVIHQLTKFRQVQNQEDRSTQAE